LNGAGQLVEIHPAQANWNAGAEDPDLEIGAYLAGKSPVLQEVLAESDLTDAEKDAILRLNTGT